MSVVISEKCIGCGQCEEVCVRNCLKLTDGKIEKDLSICNLCAHCYAICPVNAIQLTNTDNTYMPNTSSSSMLDSLTPEGLLGLMSHRRSIRKYKKDAVERKVLEDILKAGSAAPCACNAMHNRFVVIVSKRGEFIDDVLGSLIENAGELYPEDSEQTLEYRKQLWKKSLEERVTDPDNCMPAIFDAPVIILIVSPSVRDGSIAAAYMELMADSYGLGTLYNGYVSDAVNISDELRQKYGINSDEQVVISLLIGKPGRRFLRPVPRVLDYQII